MKLAKLHGLGNDFLMVSAEEAGVSDAPFCALAQELCRRHTGIGADGVIFYQTAIGDPDADVSALIFNADGSRAEMSGNGTRCLAAFLTRLGKIPSGALRIRTVAGVKTYALKGQTGRTCLFESSLGAPILDPSMIPVRLENVSAPAVNFPLSVDARIVPVTLTSMGNPHCSTFWPEVQKAPVADLGSRLERLPCFPNRTNVEFIQVLDRHRIRVRFWERGVGQTLASGTGSAAAAVAAILNGFAESPVTVELELGELTAVWEAGGELMLTGPAEFVCDVDFPISKDL
jgi:diaminopimelate epimerase